MEIRPLRASELDRAFDLDKDAFHVSDEKREGFRRFIDPARFIGAFDGNRLVAMTGALPFGQFFGGRSVPMGGLSSVAVAPDWRGQGLAKQVVRPCLAAMRQRGEVISTLMPATTSLYRSLGWELAGNATVRKVEPRALRGLPRPAAGRARPFVEDDRPAVHDCYRRLAVGANGCLDREGIWWERLTVRRRERDFYVFEGEDGSLDGYLVYGQIDGEYSALGGDFGIVVDDIVCCTRDAALGLWGLLASWASQVDQVIFRGGADDPVLLLLPEQVFQALAEYRWMTRVVDAVGAVAARGFPTGLDVEVPLRLRDAELSENEGAFVLTVQKGIGRLEARSGGDGPSLAVNGFSSLYTGWAGTAALARTGLIEGGSGEQRAALDAAFAGPTPWILDEF